ncbi:glycosyltransferase [Thermodesulfobacteriota bacterium]
MRSEVPGIRLKVIPKVLREGIALDESLDLAKRLGVSDLIDLADPVPLEQMPDVMRNAHIGVYPALADYHMDVSPSLKIPEMVNMGLPIVASRLSWLEELYGEQSIAFVPPGDPEGLAAKIAELYRDPDLRNCMVCNARETGAKLDWNSQYRAYTELVAKLVPHKAVFPSQEGPGV